MGYYIYSGGAWVSLDLSRGVLSDGRRARFMAVAGAGAALRVLRRARVLQALRRRAARQPTRALRGARPLPYVTRRKVRKRAKYLPCPHTHCCQSTSIQHHNADPQPSTPEPAAKLPQEDEEPMKELVIDLTDVNHLEEYLVKHPAVYGALDTDRFHNEDAYRESVLFKFQPLVKITRSRSMERVMLESVAKHEMNVKEFAARLGLTHIDEAKSHKKQYKTRQSNDNNNYKRFFLRDHSEDKENEPTGSRETDRCLNNTRERETTRQLRGVSEKETDKWLTNTKERDTTRQLRGVTEKETGEDKENQATSSKGTDRWLTNTKERDTTRQLRGESEKEKETDRWLTNTKDRETTRQLRRVSGKETANVSGEGSGVRGKETDEGLKTTSLAGNKRISQKEIDYLLNEPKELRSNSSEISISPTRLRERNNNTRPNAVEERDGTRRFFSKERVRRTEAGRVTKPYINKSGQQYSSLEDHAIVSWVQGGRSRLVNGNRVWRDLQRSYRNITGRCRTWQSLRNRYLRYILPALPALCLDGAVQETLRAHAALGNIKLTRKQQSTGSARRNSLFDSRGRDLPSASSRARPQHQDTKKQTQSNIDSSKQIAKMIHNLAKHDKTDRVISKNDSSKNHNDQIRRMNRSATLKLNDESDRTQTESARNQTESARTTTKATRNEEIKELAQRMLRRKSPPNVDKPADSGRRLTPRLAKTPTSDINNTKTGNDSAKTGNDSTKTGNDSTKTGNDSTKTGTDSTKTGTDSTKPGTDSTKTGNDSPKSPKRSSTPKIKPKSSNIFVHQFNVSALRSPRRLGGEGGDAVGGSGGGGGKRLSADKHLARGDLEDNKKRRRLYNPRALVH